MRPTTLSYQRGWKSFVPNFHRSSITLNKCRFDNRQSQGNISPFIGVQKNNIGSRERRRRENKNKSESTGLVIERSELFI